MGGKSRNKDLILGDTKLDWHILKYLTTTQIDSVRFLYRNFVKGKGSILSGPRRHLFNEWIIFSLLFALAQQTNIKETSNKNKNLQQKQRKCIVVSKNEGKKFVWIKFFENFLPDVLHTDTKRITKDICNFVTSCVTYRDLAEISTSLGNEKPILIIFDETHELTKELDSKFLKNLSTNVPCVFACDSAIPILDDLQQLHKIVTICGQELCYADPFIFINQFCGRTKREKLRDFIRPFYLEHLSEEVESVSYETREINQAIFDESSQNSIESTPSSNIFDCDTVKFCPNKEENTDLMIPEQNTCNMSPLQLDSKSPPTSQNIYDADTQLFEACEDVKKDKNTPQSVYGQEFHSWDSLQRHQDPPKSDKIDPNITEDLFNDSANDIEEISSTKEVIVISSGSTVGQQTIKTSISTRCTSPDDLFSDEEDLKSAPSVKQRDIPSPSAILDSPVLSSLPAIRALDRCQTKISTPIAHLVSGKAFQDSDSPIGFLSPNFWNDQREEKTKVTEESVFEITKNDVFGNVLHVNENNEISPVGDKSSIPKDRPLPKFDWSAFKDSPTSTKDSIIALKSPENVADPSPSTSSNHSSLLHTPKSKRTTTPVSSRSSSKKYFKSGEGWLNKYSPVVPKTPTSKNRRKKLETLFNDITTTPANNMEFGQLGQGMELSPNDLFE